MRRRNSIKKIAEAIEKYNVDLVIAGPAFNAEDMELLVKCL